MRHSVWGALFFLCSMTQIVEANGKTTNLFVDAKHYCGSWYFAGLPESEYNCEIKSPHSGFHYGNCHVELKTPSENNRLWIGGSNFRVDVSADGVVSAAGPAVLIDGDVLSFNVMSSPILFVSNGLKQNWSFEYDEVCGKNLTYKYMVKGTNHLLTNTMAGARVSVSADGTRVTTDNPDVFKANGLTIEFQTMKMAVFPATTGPWGLFETLVFEAGHAGGSATPKSPAWTTVLAKGKLKLVEQISGKVALFETTGGCHIEPPWVIVGGRRFDFYAGADCR